MKRADFSIAYLAKPEYFLTDGAPVKNAFSATSAKLSEGTFILRLNICEHLT